jgi:hypothetical protein
MSRDIVRSMKVEHTKYLFALFFRQHLTGDGLCFMNCGDGVKDPVQVAVDPGVHSRNALRPAQPTGHWV